jgi:hypothetical protein
MHRKVGQHDGSNPALTILAIAATATVETDRGTAIAN